jgi:16S rRNA (guanine(966)-N(2))-methyltransferase RsmD
MKKHAVRIVGGDFRKTPIPVIDAPGLRPTPDRVRETLFNWLRHFWNNQFHDKRVLDLFAGSGALGFEAASHGVAHVQMVEKNRQAAQALRALRNKLKVDAVRIHEGDALTVLERLRDTPFDLVLLDPPFGQGWLQRIWPPLAAVIKPHSLVYVESEALIDVPEGFTILRQSKAGQVYFFLLGFAAMQKTDNNSAISLEANEQVER